MDVETVEGEPVQAGQGSAQTVPDVEIVHVTTAPSESGSLIPNMTPIDFGGASAPITPGLPPLVAAFTPVANTRARDIVEPASVKKRGVGYEEVENKLQLQIDALKEQIAQQQGAIDSKFDQVVEKVRRPSTRGCGICSPSYG